jgi:hypothetical protein
MNFGNRAKVRIRHLIRTFHRWWNLGVCMFAGIRNRLAETNPMLSEKNFGGNKPHAKRI